MTRLAKGVTLYELHPDGILTNETAYSYVGRNMTHYKCMELFRYFMRARVISIVGAQSTGKLYDYQPGSDWSENAPEALYG